jgi:hypothetical protein
MRNLDRPKDELIQELEELRREVAQLQLLNGQQRWVESRLRESEDEFRDLFENAPVGYFEIDTDGLVTRVRIDGGTRPFKRGDRRTDSGSATGGLCGTDIHPKGWDDISGFGGEPAPARCGGSSSPTAIDGAKH